MKTNWFSVCSMLAAIGAGLLGVAGNAFGCGALAVFAAGMFLLSIDDWPNPPAPRGARFPAVEGLF